jgi:hypothetical protein
LKRYDAIYRGNTEYAETRLFYPRQAVFRGDLGPLDTFRQAGKRLLDQHVLFDVRSDERDQFLPKDAALSKFDAPATVRVSASRPATGNELDLHFVNYNRAEPPKDAAGNPSPGHGIAEEKPIVVKGFAADILVKEEVAAVEFITPEQPDPKPLPFKLEAGHMKFEVPEFLVYGVARVKFKPNP